MHESILKERQLTTCTTPITLQDIRTLKELYTLKAETKELREPIVRNIIKQRVVGRACVESLKNALYSLETIYIDDNTGHRLLRLDGMKQIEVDLTYEIRELQKDIYYLEYGEDKFIDYLAKFMPEFRAYVNKGVNMLKGKHFSAFITDRDGTTNNYCGRYRSSIQPIYNSVFLSRFAKNCCTHPIIITSAPLKDFGILNVSINPSHTFVYAGSKGREFIDLDGEFNSFPIEEDKQKLIHRLNDHLRVMLQDPDFEKFNFIGSALQIKFGQTTVARQDISSSIRDDESSAFLEKVKSIVREIDPEGKNFRIEDTGLDIEIILTIDVDENDSLIKDFDKGDGLAFISRELGLEGSSGPILVCGDTPSDIPMLKAAMEMFDDVWTIFVTRDHELKKEVQEICPKSITVPYPDILLTILGLLSL
ncbi:trehalose 6-phosphate synthase [Chlorobium sp. N1]|uniref:trehalose 6-phosphate synthase n=1 Tax=Chlorobium sp. N1 TaxID=2491138 RepID=UPI001038CE43|nr:trehalose 6-phosphate synthase [Chlorobium sp. N1]TCD48482.1 trehalose 6-phosphate synthase [Chlorobium sp. N1]